MNRPDSNILINIQTDKDQHLDPALRLRQARELARRLRTAALPETEIELVKDPRTVDGAMAIDPLLAASAVVAVSVAPKTLPALIDLLKVLLSGRAQRSRMTLEVSRDAFKADFDLSSLSLDQVETALLRLRHKLLEPDVEASPADES